MGNNHAGEILFFLAYQNGNLAAMLSGNKSNNLSKSFQKQ